MMMNKLKLTLPILVLVLFACGKEEKIKEVSFWKPSDGASFSDILSFRGEAYSIKNDTIFKLGLPLYKIESHEQRFLSADQVLQIKELKTGRTARYVSK